MYCAASTQPVVVGMDVAIGRIPMQAILAYVEPAEAEDAERGRG